MSQIPLGQPGEYNVCQFFDTEGARFEYVRRLVDVETAVLAARFYTDNVAARRGITKRVIITDGDDFTVFEWKFGEGVTLPTPEERAAASQRAPTVEG